MKISYWIISVAKKSIYLIALLIMAVLFLFFFNNKKELVILNGNTMGTFWQISLAEKVKDKNKLQKEIERELERINNIFSTYIKTSQISKFNQNLTTEEIELSPELAEVIQKALELSQKSNGAYDITVMPLVNLWGFGYKKIEKKPSEEEIKAALEKVGYKKLVLNGNKIKKLNPNLEIDLSSIAKGYGVDKLGDLLEKNNYKNYLINIGGELISSGSKFNNSWNIGIEVPDESSAVQEKLSIKNRKLALATSGNYRNYLDFEGERVAHTIDPKTGLSKKSKLLSVSILADNCMEADALATALMVLAEDAPNFAEKFNIPALLIFAEGENFKLVKTKEFIQKF